MGFQGLMLSALREVRVFRSFREASWQGSALGFPGCMLHGHVLYLWLTALNDPDSSFIKHCKYEDGPHFAKKLGLSQMS